MDRSMGTTIPNPLPSIEQSTSIDTSIESNSITMLTGEGRPAVGTILSNNNINSATIPSSHSTHSPSVVREFSAHKQEVCGLKW